MPFPLAIHGAWLLSFLQHWRDARTSAGLCRSNSLPLLGPSKHKSVVARAIPFLDTAEPRALAPLLCPGLVRVSLRLRGGWPLLSGRAGPGDLPSGVEWKVVLMGRLPPWESQS